MIYIFLCPSTSAMGGLAADAVLALISHTHTLRMQGHSTICVSLSLSALHVYGRDTDSKLSVPIVFHRAGGGFFLE